MLYIIVLILFEVRAQSKEAKLQVEIAKGQYLLPRLAGMKEHLYSQQGGSGFRLTLHQKSLYLYHLA